MEKGREGRTMLEIKRLIISQKKIVARKEHVCFSCGNPILKGSEYTYEKIADMKKEIFKDRRKHNQCSDPDNLKKIEDVDNPKQTWKLIRRWNNGRSSSRKYSR